MVLVLVWLFQELRPGPAPPAETGEAEVYFMPEEGPRAKARLLALMDLSLIHI